MVFIFINASLKQLYSNRVISYYFTAKVKKKKKKI